MHNLERFIYVQKLNYENCLNEIKNGKKKSHWIWYIFPQLRELGESYISDYFGISGLNEAREYLNNEYLRNNLIEISTELLKLDDDIDNILGEIDSLKLNSSMTLFKYADPTIEIFNKVIDKFYSGKEDKITVSLLTEIKKL